MIEKGLNRAVVIHISESKNEPGWMTDFRLKALEQFERMPMPSWGADLGALNINDIRYYVHPETGTHEQWQTVPENIKNTFEALGVQRAEQRFLAGVNAQFESEVIYKRLKQEWREKGVIFIDTDSAVKEHEALVRKYFATVVPPHDNKFAALNSAVWSGGSFVYVPAGVQLDQPLQAYFRINTQSMGQFERTLIIADPGSSVVYVEGCSAPVYSKSSLHSAVVELVALRGAHIRYTTIQNWSTAVYNLVTKRAIAHEQARVEWIDGNFGSKVTMKYPCVVLAGRGARATVISVAMAHAGQHQDTGGKAIHLAPETHSHIVSKSISQGGGRASYRGLVRVNKKADRVHARVYCDALLLDARSHADAYPTVLVENKHADVGHEASITQVNEEHLFYLMSRGLKREVARALIVNGFIDAFVKELPMEYAVEINRLIKHELEGSIG